MYIVIMKPIRFFIFLLIRLFHYYLLTIWTLIKDLVTQDLLKYKTSIHQNISRRSGLPQHGGSFRPSFIFIFIC